MHLPVFGPVDCTVVRSRAETVPEVILPVAAFVNCSDTANFAGSSMGRKIWLTAGNSRHLVLGIAFRLYSASAPPPHADRFLWRAMVVFNGEEPLRTEVDPFSMAIIQHPALCSPASAGFR